MPMRLLRQETIKAVQQILPINMVDVEGIPILQQRVREEIHREKQGS